MTTPFPPDGRWTAEVSFVLRALEAAARLLDVVGRSPSTLVKRDWTPVTAADLAVQAALSGALESEFPDDLLVAEESSEPLRGGRASRLQSTVVEATRLVHPQATPDQVLVWLDRGRAAPGGRFWTLDPVDGTKGLLRGGQYVTALALIEDGRIVLCGLACPRYPGGQPGGQFAVALRGGGAWAAEGIAGPWTRLSVSSESDPARGRLLRSVESGFHTSRRLGKIRRVLGMAGEEVRMHSQVKYLALAAGVGDLIIRLPRQRGARRENIWDHASGVLLVEEAGGRCTDVVGASLDFASARQMNGNLGVLASNGRLHAAALAALHRTTPASSIEAAALLDMPPAKDA